MKKMYFDTVVYVIVIKNTIELNTKKWTNFTRNSGIS